MFRRCTRRLGHQLINEPMPNVEHDTTARGRRTFGNVKTTLEQELAVMGAGIVLASFSIISAYRATPTTVRQR